MSCLLKTEISAGGGSNTPGCISRGLFVERIVGEYGFKFGVETQNVHDIRCNVQQRFLIVYNILIRAIIHHCKELHVWN